MQLSVGGIAGITVGGGVILIILVIAIAIPTAKHCRNGNRGVMETFTNEAYGLHSKYTDFTYSVQGENEIYDIPDTSAVHVTKSSNHAHGVSSENKEGTDYEYTDMNVLS